MKQNDTDSKLVESKLDESKFCACIIFGLQVMRTDPSSISAILGVSNECECSITSLVLNGAFETGADGQMLAFFHKYARLRGKCQEMYYNVGQVFHQFGELSICCVLPTTLGQVSNV